MLKRQIQGVLPPAASLLVLASVMMASCDEKAFSPREFSGKKEVFYGDSTYVFTTVLDTVYYDSAAVEKDRWVKQSLHRHL